MSDQLLIRPQTNTAVLDAEEDFEGIDLPVGKAKAGAHDQSAPHVHNGWYACSASGCYCQSYSGNADTCANCGHNFATHW